MSRRLCLALLGSLLMASVAASQAHADSVPIGQMEVMVPGGCEYYHCNKLWVSVGIGGGLTDSHGMYFPLSLTGTFFVRNVSGDWSPVVWGGSNLLFGDGMWPQVFNLGYVCDPNPCTGLRIDFTLNYSSELLVNGKKVYPDTTFSAVMLPTNGPYLYGGQTETIYLTTHDVVPEPSSLIMMGAGLLGLAGVIRREWSARSSAGAATNQHQH